MKSQRKTRVRWEPNQMTIDSKSQSSQNLLKQSRDKTLIKNKRGLPKERSTQISRMILESKSRSAIKTVLLTK